jgi:hypothetical protein
VILDHGFRGGPDDVEDRCLDRRVLTAGSTIQHADSPRPALYTLKSEHPMRPQQEED